jgi:uncharacterized protein (DUF1800 family)
VVSQARKKRPKRKPAPRCKVSRRRPPRAQRASQYAYDPELAGARRKRRTKRPAACKRRKRRPPRRPVAQPTPAPPAPRPQAVAGRLPSPIALYGGSFGRAQAERLLWRAGFGPSPGWPEALSRVGLDAAVEALVSPAGAETFTGAAPHAGNAAAPLEPFDLFGHDHLFWLDRMVRTNQPFVQRMALIWHDWFATSNNEVGSQRMMLDQYELFRRAGRGSFEQLVRQVTTDPAMLSWLNGTSNRRGAINENYARELMELFTLGADRGAYTETDVRELARSLSGWRRDYVDGIGYTNFRFDPARWDNGSKTVFGHTGVFRWDDAYRMCVTHPMHASFFVRKLWSYFIPGPPPAAEAARLESFYVQSGHQILPVIRAILRHPLLYQGPRMIKPPVVFNAGLLRAVRRAIDTYEWVNLADIAGQHLFYPPDVAGWNDERWLDSSTIRGRWQMVYRVLNDGYVSGSTAQNNYDRTETPEAALQRAVGSWASPELTSETRASLLGFSQSCFIEPSGQTQKSQYRAYRQNALMQLIGVSPDLQTG